MQTDRYCSLHSKIRIWDLAGKQVFVRADLNVSIEQGAIIDDTRLQAIRPTLDAILNKNGLITLATHIGRPAGYQENLSTQIIAQWLHTRGYDNHITVLENLRFFAGETDMSHTFAQQLAEGIDYYVDDAFASAHRSSASLTIMPQLFDREHKSIGLLVERELSELSKLKYHAKKPFVLIVGGGKAVEKLPFLQNMLDLVSDILLCPAFANIFLTNTPQAQNVIALAQQKQVKFHLPIDYLVSHPSTPNLWSQPFIYKKTSEIKPEDSIIAIGPQTIEQWKPIIMNAQTIFFNGPMGNLKQPATIETLHKLLQLIAESPAWSVVGGGDSLAALHTFGLQNKIGFCSTGGGATLAYLSNQTLPALDALL